MTSLCITRRAMLMISWVKVRAHKFLSLERDEMTRYFTSWCGSSPVFGALDRSIYVKGAAPVCLQMSLGVVSPLRCLSWRRPFLSMSIENGMNDGLALKLKGRERENNRNLSMTSFSKRGYSWTRWHATFKSSSAHFHYTLSQWWWRLANESSVMFFFLALS